MACVVVGRDRGSCGSSCWRSYVTSDITTSLVGFDATTACFGLWNQSLLLRCGDHVDDAKTCHTNTSQGPWGRVNNSSIKCLPRDTLSAERGIATQMFSVRPSVCLKRWGIVVIKVAGPRAWNTDCSSPLTFKKYLKNYLFSLSF